MSTSYQMLREPWTSARVESTPKHDKVTLWENHANCGTLVLSAGCSAMFLCQIARDDYPPAMRTRAGGPTIGIVVTEHPASGALDPSMVLVSEYGELVTVAEVRAMAGEGKAQDGERT